MLNYLARLGWSHGDEELFSREQMVDWFDGSHLAKSPAQWDPAKLAWVNAQYLKQADDWRLATLVSAELQRRGVAAAEEGAPMAARCALFKDRCITVVELADWLEMYFVEVRPSQADLDAHVPASVHPALASLRERLATVLWDKAAVAQAIKDTLAEHKLKMPQLAVPLRVLVCGRSQAPSVDAVLALFDRDVVLGRLAGA
jgi:glutamyl-tRNA synthetase